MNVQRLSCTVMIQFRYPSPLGPVIASHLWLFRIWGPVCSDSFGIQVERGLISFAGVGFAGLSV
jgi:hypothetical protein